MFAWRACAFQEATVTGRLPWSLYRGRPGPRLRRLFRPTEKAHRRCCDAGDSACQRDEDLDMARRPLAEMAEDHGQTLAVLLRLSRGDNGRSAGCVQGCSTHRQA